MIQVSVGQTSAHTDNLHASVQLVVDSGVIPYIIKLLDHSEIKIVTAGNELFVVEHSTDPCLFVCSVESDRQCGHRH